MRGTAMELLGKLEEAYQADRSAYLYTASSLEALVPHATDLGFIVRDLVSDGRLETLCDGLWLYRPMTGEDPSFGRCLLEEALLCLRPGCVSYESLESAASQWGLISQVPIAHLMCMTTGESGEWQIRDEVLEAVHTNLSEREIFKSTIDLGRGHVLRLANRNRCLKDLLDCGRSVDLIDWEEVEGDD